VVEGSTNGTERTRERFSMIEAHHIALQKEVTNLTKDVAALTVVTRQQAEGIQVVESVQRAAAKPDWAVLISALTLVFLIGGLVLWEPLRDIRTTVIAHLKDGHPQRVTDIIQDWKDLDGAETRRFDNNFEKADSRLTELEVGTESIIERLLNVERELFAGAAYRSGRPVPSSPSPQGP